MVQASETTKSENIYKSMSKGEREGDGKYHWVVLRELANQGNVLQNSIHFFLLLLLCFLFSRWLYSLRAEMYIKLKNPKILYAARTWCGRAHVIKVKRILYRWFRVRLWNLSITNADRKERNDRTVERENLWCEWVRKWWVVGLKESQVQLLRNQVPLS
jgi:hypothetical protein